jgi:hypothetical protein
MESKSKGPFSKTESVSKSDEDALTEERQYSRNTPISKQPVEIQDVRIQERMES